MVRISSGQHLPWKSRTWPLFSRRFATVRICGTTILQVPSKVTVLAKPFHFWSPKCRTSRSPRHQNISLKHNKTSHFLITQSISQPNQFPQHME
nr:Hypothetical protein [Aeromonas caviae]